MHLKINHSKRLIPGYRFTLSCTVIYLLLVVIIPILMMLLHATTLPWHRVWAVIASERVTHALLLTFSAAFGAALINGGMGLIVSWVLVRYRFFGRGMLDALIDIPFAIPTAVAGIALATLFDIHGWLGAPLAAMGIGVAFTQAGVWVALIFVGLPFVIRMVQPVLQHLSQECEEAAFSLGATPWQTFTKVIFPQLIPPLISGMSLAFARGLGEFGSVIFIAGNMPFHSEVISLVIFMKLEQHDFEAATVIATCMLLLSVTIMLSIHRLEYFLQRYFRQG